MRRQRSCHEKFTKLGEREAQEVKMEEQQRETNGKTSTKKTNVKCGCVFRPQSR